MIFSSKRVFISGWKLAESALAASKGSHHGQSVARLYAEVKLSLEAAGFEALSLTFGGEASKNLRRSTKSMSFGQGWSDSQ